MTYPRARKSGLQVQEISGEFLIYNTRTRTMHRLTTTTALVWQNCNGRNSVITIGEMIAKGVALSNPSSIVEMALAELSRAGLLEEAIPAGVDLAVVSRRQFVQKLGIAASMAALIPVVESMSLPAHADGDQNHRCQGKHVTNARGEGVSKHEALDNMYLAANLNDDQVCKTFACDEGSCESTQRITESSNIKPSCTKIVQETKDHPGKWRCTLKYFAVCGCRGGA